MCGWRNPCSGRTFDQYGFTFYNLKEHKPGRTWAGTDIGAAILQIVAQGDNPYDYQG